MKNTAILSWSELIESYEENTNISFEQYFCNEFNEPYIDTEAIFKYLDRKYRGKFFVVKPVYDYIKWKGTLNSDFKVSLL